jgi:GT2 family glycosyltransferase
MEAREPHDPRPAAPGRRRADKGAPAPAPEVDISVVVAVRDQGRLVTGLLSALDAQTLPPERFEVIVVDDASRDETQTIVRRWVAAAPERRVLATGAGRGPGAARNLGIRSARAPWIAFTDGDTLPEPDWLEAALAAAAREQADAIEGAVVPGQVEARGPFGHHVVSNDGGRFMTANMIYSRGLLERLSGFDERFQGAFLEDSDLAFRALEAGVRIPFAPEVRVRHPVYHVGARDVLRSARKTRWFPLFASKHEGRYRSDLRPVVRPLTSVDLDVLVGLLALSAVPRARAFARAALLVAGANGVRRGLGSGRLSAAGADLPACIAVSLALPVARAFWLAEGSIRFKKLTW